MDDIINEIFDKSLYKFKLLWLFIENIYWFFIKIEILKYFYQKLSQNCEKNDLIIPL